MKLSTDQVLEAALDEASLRALLDVTCEEIGSKGYAAGWAGGTAVEQIFCFRNDWTPEMLADYFEKYAVTDPWTAAFQADPRFDCFVRMSELVTPGEWEASALWSELLEPGGDDTFFALAMKVMLDGGMGGLTFYRGREAGDFTDEALQALAPAEPLIAKLMRLRGAVALGGVQGRNWRLLVDRFAGDIFVLDLQRRLVDANASARARIKARDGVELLFGRLAPVCPRLVAPFVQACETATAGAVGQTVVLEDAAGDPLRFQVVRTGGNGDVGRLLLLGELPRHVSSATLAHVKAAFGLTPTETKVMVAIASGLKPDEVAAQRGVGFQTVRTQYRSALAKMGCRRLPEAVAMLQRQFPLA